MNNILKKAFQTTNEHYFSIIGMLLTLMLAAFVFSLIPGIFAASPYTSFGVSLFTSMLNSYFSLGLILLVIKMARGESYEFKDMFMPFTKFIQYIPAYLLVMFVLFIILLPFILTIGFDMLITYFNNPISFQDQPFEPSTLSVILLSVSGLVILYLAIRVTFFQYYFMEENVSGVFALTETFKSTSGHEFHIFTLFLVIIVINILGALLLLVGLLYTIPLSMVIMSHYYAEYINPKTDSLEAEIKEAE